MGAKRRRPGDCRCGHGNVVPSRLAMVLDEPLDELQVELRELHVLDEAAYYDPDEVGESKCR